MLLRSNKNFSQLCQSELWSVSMRLTSLGIKLLAHWLGIGLALGLSYRYKPCHGERSGLSFSLLHYCYVSLSSRLSVK